MKKNSFKMVCGTLGILLLVGACGNAVGDQKSGSDKAVADTVVAEETPTEAPDADGDGFEDSEDAFPEDDREWLDENANGVGDNQEALEAKERQARAEARAKRRQARQRAAAIANANAPSERDWALVVKDPDRHTGEFHVIYGQITQFDAATGDTAFLADTANRNTTSYGYFDGANTLLMGRARQLANFVEEDVFQATVEVTGSFSYDTQIGGNTTVPQLRVLKIHRIG